MTVNLNL